MNIHVQNDRAFIYSCFVGDIELVKLLIENGTNIHVHDDLAFFSSCANGQHIEIVKLFIEHETNITDQYNKIFINSCKNGYIKVVKLLIKHMVNKTNNIDEICLIYQENKNEMIKLNCFHVLCIDCFIRWINERKTLFCPYCQQKINLKECYIN